MHAGYAFLATYSLSLVQLAGANSTFYLKDQWRGNDFFNGWEWDTAGDLTNGRVNYVSQADAICKNLTYADGDKFFMRADDWSLVDASARGRDSVRIVSQAAYTEAIFVLDLAHMPAGCATWPAFWTDSQAGPWPAGGEIDIIEGVNLNTQNQATLHTLPNCTMPPAGPDRLMTGTAVSDNCDASVNGNEGCGVTFDSTLSYGAAFNLNRGGYYVMSRSQDSGINVWFWPRNSSSVPAEIAKGGEALSPDSTWGEPVAAFPTDPDNCNYDGFFDAHSMIFDLTFCGDWAGNAGVWAASGCGTHSDSASVTCADYVDYNPLAFSEAYWEINSLSVYTS